MSGTLSFSGRSGRKEFWAWSLVAAVLLLGSALLWYVQDSITLAVPLALVAVALWVPACVRRLHDRGKSAGWVLLAVVPLVGTLWSIVALGFRRGTPGLNTYGRPVEPIDVDLVAGAFAAAPGPRLTNAMWNQPLLLGRRSATRPCPGCGGVVSGTSCGSCGTRLDAPVAATLKAS